MGTETPELDRSSWHGARGGARGWRRTVGAVPSDADVWSGHRHGAGFGHGPMGWMGPHFRRGAPRARRGDVRAALLVLLAEGPHNGYQLIQEIELRSGGVWRPSPGSVYPALLQLEDEGLVRAREGGGKLVELTEEGRGFVAAHADELGAPWEEVRDGPASVFVEMRALVAQVAAAAVQVSMAGSADDLVAARRILTGARRSLYRVLAEGGGAAAELDP